MLSTIESRSTRVFTYLWIVLFLSSQGLAFAGRSATEIAVREWDPLSGPIAIPLRSTNVAEELDVGLASLSLTDAIDTVASTTAVSANTSAPPTVSLSPEERQRHMQKLLLNPHLLSPKVEERFLSGSNARWEHLTKKAQEGRTTAPEERASRDYHYYSQTLRTTPVTSSAGERSTSTSTFSSEDASIRVGPAPYVSPSAISSSSASPGRHPSMEGGREPIIPGFRSFLDDLEVVAKLSEQDFVLRDTLREVIVFHRVCVRGEPTFVRNGPSKRSGIAQEFSRSWIADRLEAMRQEDILEQIIMDRYDSESSSSEDEVSEEPTRQYSCIRTASAVIPQADGLGQVKFYAVYDQLKPGRQEQSETKLRPDGFYFNTEWSQEDFALVYLDYLAASYIGHVVNFSSKGINNIDFSGYLQRLKRIFQFDPVSHYSINFSYNSLNSHSIRNLGSLLGSPPYLTRVIGINLSHNRFELLAGYLEPLIPLLTQDTFRELDVRGNHITSENVDTLVGNAKSITQREEAEVKQSLSKIKL